MSNEAHRAFRAGRAAPILLVVSAPSGAGKTTLCDRLRAEFDSIVYSVSCTTRPPRAGEVNGVHYTFLDETEFERRAAAGAFLEHARVHGHRYGTPRAAVAAALASGRDVLMDIDVQGAALLRNAVSAGPADDPLRRAFVDVFIEPPSIEALRERLERRAQDSAETIARRLRQAGEEMSRRGEYRYAVVNDRLDLAYDALRAIFIAEHCRLERIPDPGRHQ